MTENISAHEASLITIPFLTLSRFIKFSENHLGKTKLTENAQIGQEMGTGQTLKEWVGCRAILFSMAECFN